MEWLKVKLEREMVWNKHGFVYNVHTRMDCHAGDPICRQSQVQLPREQDHGQFRGGIRLVDVILAAVRQQYRVIRDIQLAIDVQIRRQVYDAKNGCGRRRCSSPVHEVGD